MEERVKLKKRLKVAISQNLGVDFTEGVRLGTTYSENVARRIQQRLQELGRQNNSRCL
jgi:hypothetical protein